MACPYLNHDKENSNWKVGNLYTCNCKPGYTAQYGGKHIEDNSSNISFYKTYCRDNTAVNTKKCPVFR